MLIEKKLPSKVQKNNFGCIEKRTLAKSQAGVGQLAVDTMDSSLLEIVSNFGPFDVLFLGVFGSFRFRRCFLLLSKFNAKTFLFSNMKYSFILVIVHWYDEDEGIESGFLLFRLVFHLSYESCKIVSKDTLSLVDF